MSGLQAREVRRRHEVRIKEEDRDPDVRQVGIRRVERRVHRGVVRELEMLACVDLEELGEREGLRVRDRRYEGHADYEKCKKDDP
jgi:hypothetical protein